LPRAGVPVVFVQALGFASSAALPASATRALKWGDDCPAGGDAITMGMRGQPANAPGSGSPTKCGATLPRSCSHSRPGHNAIVPLSVSAGSFPHVPLVGVSLRWKDDFFAPALRAHC
jgi:hypothetical protein